MTTGNQPTDVQNVLRWHFKELTDGELRMFKKYVTAD